MTSNEGGENNVNVERFEITAKPDGDISIEFPMTHYCFSRATWEALAQDIFTFTGNWPTQKPDANDDEFGQLTRDNIALQAELDQTKLQSSELAKKHDSICNDYRELNEQLQATQKFWARDQEALGEKDNALEFLLTRVARMEAAIIELSSLISKGK